MTTLKPCPFCGGEAAVRDIKEPSVNGWVGCQRCRCFMDFVKNGKPLAIAAWNRRTQPENARQRALQTGVCPMCEDCPDGCPVETPNDSRNRPENEPLTLEELRQAKESKDPVWMNRSKQWTFVASVADAPYAQVWYFTAKGMVQTVLYHHETFYRRKPERSEG